MKKELLIDLVKGIFAGTMIGIGGIVYLNSANSFIGACLFSVGLLTICIYKMNLFTGMVGYILINKKSYILKLSSTIIGNFIGTFICALGITFTRISTISSKARNLVDIKLNDNYLSVFILAIFCGILMYIAVNNYKKVGTEIGKYIGIFMCVMTFILCGFEHCIANMAYITIANAWSWKALLYVLIMILGNSFGAILIAYFYNLYYKN